MRKILSGVLALVLLLSVTSFAAAEDPVTITLWHRWSGNNEAVLTQMVSEFEAANPDVKVELTGKAGGYFELLESMLADAAAGNDLPDIFIGGYNLLNYIAMELNPVPVDQLAPDADAYQALTSQFLDMSLPLGQWDGSQVGLPMACSTMVMFVNNDILTAAGIETIPTTWEELIDDCAVIKEKTDKYGVGIQFFDTWSDQALVFSAGGDFLTKDGQQVDFTNDGLVKAITMWQSLYANGYEPLCTSNEQAASFTAGNIAFYMTTIMTLPSNKEYCKFNMSVAETPSFEGMEKKLPVGGAAMFSFSKTDAKKAAVWKFMNYFATDGVKTFLNTGYINPTKVDVAIQPEQQPAYDQMKSIMPWECWPGGAAGLEIETEWNNTRTDIIQNGLPVLEMLQTLQDECNALLN